MKWTGILTGVFLTDTIRKSRAEKHLSDKAVREIAGDKILLRKLHNYGLACNLGEKHPKLRSEEHTSELQSLCHVHLVDRKSVV